jgi:isoleucyl-tRNA synthetase
VDINLSNWYVRLSRKRFWTQHHGELPADKASAYDTLYTCLKTVAQLAAPFAPFFSDWLFGNLSGTGERLASDSVHLSFMPNSDVSLIDNELEERMGFAQEISSMVLSIRKKENLRVRQPLSTIRIPILQDSDRQRIEAVSSIILAETNVKQLELVDESQANIVKNLKLNFKSLGSKCGKHMKAVQAYALEHSQALISAIEGTGSYQVVLADVAIELTHEDVDIIPVDIPGWKVANDGALTVALDITITEDLRLEGIAREFVNRIQNLRKDLGFEVTDKIYVKILRHNHYNDAIVSNSEYIRAQILANSIELVDTLLGAHTVEIEEGVSAQIEVTK